MFGFTRVKMVASVGGRHVAGRKYWLPKAEADKYIIRRYAEGKLSRVFSEDEKAELRSNMQSLSV